MYSKLFFILITTCIWSNSFAAQKRYVYMDPITQQAIIKKVDEIPNGKKVCEHIMRSAHLIFNHFDEELNSTPVFGGDISFKVYLVGQDRECYIDDIFRQQINFTIEGKVYELNVEVFALSGLRTSRQQLGQIDLYNLSMEVLSDNFSANNVTEYDRPVTSTGPAGFGGSMSLPNEQRINSYLEVYY